MLATSAHVSLCEWQTLKLRGDKQYSTLKFTSRCFENDYMQDWTVVNVSLEFTTIRYRTAVGCQPFWQTTWTICPMNPSQEKWICIFSVAPELGGGGSTSRHRHRVHPCVKVHLQPPKSTKRQSCVTHGQDLPIVSMDLNAKFWDASWSCVRLFMDECNNSFTRAKKYRVGRFVKNSLSDHQCFPWCYEQFLGFNVRFTQVKFEMCDWTTLFHAVTGNLYSPNAHFCTKNGHQKVVCVVPRPQLTNCFNRTSEKRAK